MRDQQKRKHPTEGHHAGQGAGIQDGGESERTDFAQHGEEKEKGNLVAALHYLKVTEKWGLHFFFGETLQKKKGQPSQAVIKEI